MDYLPAESNTGMFGGNSNWRGPIWMPVNALIIRALQQFYLYYGDSFKIECPTGSGTMMNLFEVSRELVEPAHADFPARRARPAAGVRWDREVPGRPVLARSPPVLRILPWRQRRRARRQPPDRLDGRGGQGASSSTACWIPNGCLKWGNWPGSNERPRARWRTDEQSCTTHRSRA